MGIIMLLFARIKILDTNFFDFLIIFTHFMTATTLIIVPMFVDTITKKIKSKNKKKDIPQIPKIEE